MNSRGVVSIIIVIVAIAGIAYVLANVPQKQKANSEMFGGEGTYTVATSTVSYSERVKGFYAEPKEKGNYPGVVMIHEWWGLNDNIRAMAEELARHGYRVLAVDLFGKVAATPEEARMQVSSLDSSAALKNLRSAAAFVRSQGSSKVASLGWCFGGGQSLQLAISGEPLAATIIYYGNLSTSTSELSNIDWPVLGIFGDKDTSIPVTVVKQFESVLDSVGIENDIYIYPGVGHAFANPSGANYAVDEMRDAWGKTLDFLEKNLKE